MKLQQLIYKIEELKALISLYEQTMSGLAQATVLLDSLGEETDEEQTQQVRETVETIQARSAAVEKLLLERTGKADLDAAVDVVHEHIARMQQFQQVRSDQLQLRTQLDLELTMGTVSSETRQQAETNLQAMQNRLDTLVRLGQDALASPKLISLS